MQFKDLDELKDFIIWAKSQKITRIRVGEIEVDILPLSYVDAETDRLSGLPEMYPDSKAWIDTAPPEDS